VLAAEFEEFSIRFSSDTLMLYGRSGVQIDLSCVDVS